MQTAIRLPELGDLQLRPTRLHFLDARLTRAATTPIIELVGDDNTSLTREVGMDTTIERVVTGRMSVRNTRSEETLSIDPLFMREGSPLSLLAQNIDFLGLEGDEIRRDYYEVKFDNAGNVMAAIRMNSWVQVTSVGGDADEGDTLVVELAFDGIRIPQTFEQLPNGTFVFEDDDD